MRAITTTFLDGKAVVFEKTGDFICGGRQPDLNVINLYPQVKFQEVLGFGGAFTEAAGYVYSKVSDELKQEILESYFGKDGLHYTLGRATIDSCDFSLGNFSAVTDPTDAELKTFSLARDEQYSLPLIYAAQEVSGGKIRIMLSPWSPPAFMKTNGEKNNGGSLLPEYSELWAAYICKYIKEYRARGVDVFCLSVQNEPDAKQTWDSCTYTKEQERAFVKNFLAPALKANGLSDVLLTIWDHNKERAFDRAEYICAEKDVDSAVGAIGFHWYTGDHFEAVELLSKVFPDKKLLFTEGCVEYSRFEKDNQLHNANMYAHEMIGSFNAGMHGFLDWNLLLTHEGGPNHVGNLCDAPIMCNLDEGTLVKKLSYYYIGHFSKYIQNGARRVGFSRYSSVLEVTAFENPDGEVVAVILNQGSEDRTFYLRMNDSFCAFLSPAESIMTVII